MIMMMLLLTRTIRTTLNYQSASRSRREKEKKKENVPASIFTHMYVGIHTCVCVEPNVLFFNTIKESYAYLYKWDLFPTGYKKNYHFYLHFVSSAQQKQIIIIK